MSCLKSDQVRKIQLSQNLFYPIKYTLDYNPQALIHMAYEKNVFIYFLILLALTEMKYGLNFCLFLCICTMFLNLTLNNDLFQRIQMCCITHTTKFCKV